MRVPRLLVAVAAVAALAACSSPVQRNEPAASSGTTAGSTSIPLRMALGNGCDIPATPMKVTVTDQSGVPLGSGEIAGVDGPWLDGDGKSYTACVYDGSIPVEAADIYLVRLAAGRFDRTYSLPASQASDPMWNKPGSDLEYVDN